MSQYYLDALNTELVSLCELRGELNKNDNERTERRIEEIRQEQLNYEAQLEWPMISILFFVIWVMMIHFGVLPVGITAICIIVNLFFLYFDYHIVDALITRIRGSN